MRNVFLAGQLGASIVNEMSNLINEEVILTDEEGTIIASTDQTRVDQFHEGALLAIKQKEQKLMTEEMTRVLEGVKKGVVIPIIIDGAPLGSIGITGNPDIVSPYAMLVQRVAELFINDSLVKEVEENQAREVDFFVFDWLRASEINDSLLDRGEFLNISMETFQQVIVFHSEPDPLQISYKDMETIRGFWNYGKNVLLVRWGQNKLLLLTPTFSKEELKPKLEYFKRQIEKTFGLNLAVGVGQPATYTSLERSFEQADRASEVSVKRNQVVFEEDLRFDMLLHGLNEDTQAEFIRRTIEPIMNEAVLMESLEMWFKNDMSFTKTSEAMHVHKNTLKYRLSRIEELTNLKIKSIHDLTILYISYRFCDKEQKKS